MNYSDRYHIVVVEAYQGLIEFLSDQETDRTASQGLGLPLEEIADQLTSRISLLSWQDWYPYELRETYDSTPGTRPISPSFPADHPAFDSAKIRRLAIPPIDPDYEQAVAERGLSPRSTGLISDSGLLFFLSCCLDKYLRDLYREDPFDAVIFPMWGGLGYVFQMARATRAPGHIDVPIAVVVTDTSANRHAANDEGVWTRQAIVRRQMEDVALALADLPLVFGPRAKEIALRGSLPESSPPVLLPRFVHPRTLDGIQTALSPRSTGLPVQFFLYEPQDAASGVLTSLDAVQLLRQRGFRFDCPVISGGPPMVFAPMKPQSFQEYWSSRGWVRKLLHDRQWEWCNDYPRLADTYSIRLYPSRFEHLPDIWTELAAGTLVLASPAAAEGLALEDSLPEEVILQGDPTPERLADHLENIARTDSAALEQLRQELCRRVLAAHRGEQRRHLLDHAVTALDRLLGRTFQPNNLERVALLFLDRRLSLRTIAENDRAPSPRGLDSGIRKGALSVVVTCYEMRSMVKEAVESVWASERLPDEILLIDDGSHGEETVIDLHELEQRASETGLPLRVIRQQNQGLAKARNTGLQTATGEFISFLDGDDMIDPAFYRVAVELLQRHPRLGGVGAWARIFGDLDGYWNAPQPELPFLFGENSVIVPCMMRTDLLRQLGGYDVQQRYNYEDWELGIRLLASGWPIVNIPRHLQRYRHRLDSLFRGMTNVQNQVMRELLLGKHRETVSRFAVEITMQIENKLHRFLHPDKHPESRPEDQLASASPALDKQPETRPEDQLASAPPALDKQPETCPEDQLASAPPTFDGQPETHPENQLASADEIPQQTEPAPATHPEESPCVQTGPKIDDRPLKHLLICREFPPSPIQGGGIGTYAHNIARLLAESGETVHVIGQLWENAPKRTEEQCDGRLIIHRVPLDDWGSFLLRNPMPDYRDREVSGLLQSSYPHQAFSWQASLLAETLSEQEGIDIVEAQEWEAPLYYLQLRRALGLGPQTCPPCIVHLHSPIEPIARHNDWTIFENYFLTAKRFEDYTIAAADALLCPSHFLAQEVEARYGLSESSVHVIPYPMNEIPVVERDKQCWEEGSICYIGRLEGRKGVLEWIDAAVLVARDHPKVQFDFVGANILGTQTMSGEEIALRRIPSHLRCQFHFHGNQSRSKLSVFLSRARMAVVPSRWENFPNTCIEAMASGLPVLASPNGGMAEMLEDGVTGWIAPTPDAEGLAVALRRALATAPDTLSEMGRRAAQSIREICDKQKVLERQLGFRRQVLKLGARQSVQVPDHLPFGRRVSSKSMARVAVDGSTSGIAIVVSCQEVDSPLIDCLQGLERQTQKPLTVVILHGGSPDRQTRKALNQLRWDGWNVIETPELDQAAMKNSGIQTVLDQHLSPLGFAFLAGNEKLDAEFVSGCEAALRRCPEVGLVTCWTHRSDSYGGLWVRPCPSFPYQWVCNDLAPFSVVRTDALLKSGLFREGLSDGYEVWDLFNSVMAAGWKAVTLPQILAFCPDWSGRRRTDTAHTEVRMRQQLLGRFPKLVAQDATDIMLIQEAMNIESVRHDFWRLQEDLGNVIQTAKSPLLTTKWVLAKVKDRIRARSIAIVKLVRRMQQ